MKSSPLKGVIIGLLLLLSISVVGTVGYMLIEGWSLLDSLYMSIITISTIGYGETRELSQGGRVFTLMFILLGLGTSVYTFTRLGQLIFEGELIKFIGERKMQAQLDRIKEHFIICGYGRVGQTVAKGLIEKSIPFVVIEQNKETLELLNDDGILHIFGDATEEETLEKAGISKATTLLSMLSTDADNLYLVISARELNPDLNIIAKAMDEKAERRLEQGGASHVISPYRIASYHMLHAATSPNVLKYLELGSHQGHTVSMQEIRLSDNSPLVNKTIIEANIRNDFDISIVAIKRGDDELIVNPKSGERMLGGDILVSSGTNEALDDFLKKCL